MTPTVHPVITITSEHFPISVNALFANVAGRGRVRTKRYNEWAQAAGWDCLGKGSITGPFQASIIISRKRARANADLDNFPKGIIDLMVKHGIVEDDHLLQRLTIEYGDCTGFCIELRPYLMPL